MRGIEDLGDGLGPQVFNPVICTPGSTMRRAGSRQAFRTVDVDCPLSMLASRGKNVEYPRL